MAAQTLDSTSGHETRVRLAEFNARSVDYTKGDFTTLQSALASVEECQDLWDTLKLDPAIRQSLSSLFKEQKRRFQVTANLLDNLVSRYDRFLDLVWYLHLYSSEDLIKQYDSCSIIPISVSQRRTQSNRNQWQLSHTTPSAIAKS